MTTNSSLGLRLFLAILGGCGIYTSYAPLSAWPLGILGVALLFLSILGTNARRAAIIAITHYLTIFLLALPWIGEFVGTMPYVALSVWLALYGAIFGATGAVLARREHGIWLLPLVFLATEWLRSHFPFGGFAWMRVAWGQVDGPLAQIATLGGPALVSLAVAVCAAALVALLICSGPRVVAASVLVLVLATAAWGGLYMDRGTPTGEVTVAAVQGNVPRLGWEFNAQRRAVLANHVAETEAISQPVDLVIWPENSADVNPFTDHEAAALIQQAVAHVAAPILVGTLTEDTVGDHNTMQVFNSDGSLGEYHYKKFLQPFGEYMPLRDFFRLFSPLVDRAGNYQPGTGTGVVSMTAAQTNQNVLVGIMTCYEVAFDAAGRSAIKNGAGLLTTPTNNATFGFTDMTYQQLAMSRMRAIELDRAVVVAATSGVSAIILPDGTVTQDTQIFEAAHLIETLPLKDTVNPSVRFGNALELFFVIIGWLAIGAAAMAGRTPRRRTLTNGTHHHENSGYHPYLQ